MSLTRQSYVLSQSFPVPKRRVCEELADVLVEYGVEVVFGLPGGTIAPIYDAFLDHPEIRTVSSRHEGAAMFAAAAYARVTGKPAVVMVTSGPGALNCVTGLASALTDSLPLVVLAGEVPRSVFGRGALQEGSSAHLNVVAVTRNVTKFSAEAISPGATPSLLRKAFRTAASGRPGPVFLTLPLDVLGSECVAPRISNEVFVEFGSSERSIEEAGRTILEAKRLAILVGSGARWGKGHEAVRSIAEKLQCPVMTTPKGKGIFPESHPLSLGVFGHGGHPSATSYLSAGIDVLLAVGTGMSDPATNGWSPLLQPNKTLIHIDADVAQIGRNYETQIGIVGKAEKVLPRLDDWLMQAIGKEARAVKTFGVRHHEDSEMALETEGYAPQRAIWELQQALPAETLYTCDIGEHLLFTTHYLRVDDPMGFSIMTGIASMGSAIPSALGVQLARPSRPVVAICGDGCFSMSLSEIGTAVQMGAPIIVVVLNDRRYGMVEMGNMTIYGRTPSYPCDEMSVVRTAEGLGANAFSADNPGDILKLNLHQRLMTRTPIVVDVRIDQSVGMPKDSRRAQLKKTLAHG